VKGLKTNNLNRRGAEAQRKTFSCFISYFISCCIAPSAHKHFKPLRLCASAVQSF
jgi:hypothetical protein